MFEKWYLEELMSKNVRDIWPLTDKYLIQLIKNIFDEVGITNDLNNFTSINKIIEKYKFSEKSYNAIKWCLERLKFDEHVISEENKDESKYKWSEKKIDFNLDEIYNLCISKEPEASHSFKILKLMADNYIEFLKGTKTGVEIIFSPENIHIINEYYEKSIFYNANNLVAAKVVNYEVSQKKNPKILELGGGLGGGTKQFLYQRKKENLSMNDFSYHFTDVANKMLRITRKVIEEIVGGDISNFEFSKFDFNKSLAEIEQPENSYDIIWAVNAIHVAYDLKFSLKEIYKLLKPNGVLLIAETVRPVLGPMIQHEFVINTLDDYWNVKLDPVWRPNYGFMKWNYWINALKEAGFDGAETVPDMKILENEYGNCYTTVIKGFKKG